MNGRPKLEVAGWIGSILAVLLGAVAYIWPRAPSEEPKPSPTPTNQQVNQSGSTATQINGPVTIYTQPVPVAAPVAVPAQAAPHVAVLSDEPIRAHAVSTAPQVASEGKTCLSLGGGTTGSHSSQYLSSTFCEDFRTRLERITGCEVASLTVEPSERTGEVTNYGLSESFVDQSVRIRYSVKGECKTGASSQFVASRRWFPQLNKFVHGTEGTLHAFALAATFGNE